MGARVMRRVSLIHVATLHAACAAFSATMPSATRAQEAPPPAYQSAARMHGVPADVLFAIALQESGMALRGRLIPWPWTLNVAGRPLRYANRTQACAALLYALKQLPPTRVDVGLGQINVGFQGHRVERPCALLDPYHNLALAALILREHYTASEDWLIAIGHYHSPAGGQPAEQYRGAVQRHLRRVLGASTGAATALNTLP